MFFKLGDRKWRWCHLQHFWIWQYGEVSDFPKHGNYRYAIVDAFEVARLFYCSGPM